MRHSWSCLSDLWDSQSNANSITVQCKVGKCYLLQIFHLGIVLDTELSDDKKFKDNSDIT